ncbi:MAG TPA: hypothetical protein PKY56_12365 [Candidatus Kapabacteria bacterium]|nr:hypothetical protein [Candidatus Kapabacteria bacterium]HPO63351.1 hypothetical protein [Candidatus Kapabacteria bacterium]
MKSKIILTIIFLIININSIFSHPPTPFTKSDQFPINELNLYFQKSDLYDFQIELNAAIFGGMGFFKNIYASLVDFSYGLRVVDRKLDSKFKAVVITYQGIFPTVLLSNGSKIDTTFEELIHFQMGFKGYEYNSLKTLLKEETYFRVNADFLYERRKYAKDHFIGLPYEPCEYNPYLILSPYLEGVTIDIGDDNNSKFLEQISGLGAGCNIDLGFEIRNKVEYFEKKYNYTRTYVNKVLLFLNSKFIIGNSYRMFNYGVKFNFDFFKYFFPFEITICKNDVYYKELYQNNFIISLGLKHPFLFSKYF